MEKKREKYFFFLIYHLEINQPIKKSNFNQSQEIGVVWIIIGDFGFSSSPFEAENYEIIKAKKFLEGADVSGGDERERFPNFPHSMFLSTLSNQWEK